MLRIGTVPYLVARPLTWGLERDPQVSLSVATPEVLAAGLNSGEIDVALASSILALEPDAFPFWHQGPVIAARGPIRSVLLLLRPGVESPREIKRLGLDPHSRTGRALAEIVLRDHYGVECVSEEISDWSQAFDQGLDAVQLIGDPALRARAVRPDWKILDLGETWAELTRLPFVFAGWIGRRGFDPMEAAHILDPAAVQGLSQRDALVAEGSAQLGHNSAFLQRYLFQDLSYRLPAATVHAALAEFQARLRLPVS